MNSARGTQAIVALLRVFLCSAILCACNSLNAAALSVVAAAKVSAQSQYSMAEPPVGKVRGSTVEGVSVFKGIRYAVSSAQTGRFMPSVKQSSWVGTRDALRYAPQCPQIDMYAALSPEVLQLLGGAAERSNEYGEDCLALNVWTRGPVEGRKRPVMIWLHGGGFAGGAGDVDAINLVNHGDVVMVSLNHRLDVLGYLHLGDVGGEKYSASGNVGMLDIVTALQWVRDNIAAFGGDPSNVTIFGDSGGGWKVRTLMLMPKARGLFHKAIVLSGSSYHIASRQSANRVTERFLAQLGLNANQLDRLQELPTSRLLAATQQVRKDLGGFLGTAVFGAVADGQWVLDPSDPKAAMLSAQVPMIIGNTRDEIRLFMKSDDLSLDENSMRSRAEELTGLSGSALQELIGAYRNSHPTASPVDILFAMTTDYRVRYWAIEQSERKALQRNAPVYMYRFDWAAPAFAGKYGAAHGIDVVFAFDNAGKASGLGGTESERAALASRVSSAWIAFAHTGNPNHEGLPHWAPYDLKNRATMLFDNECTVARDPDREVRLAIGKLLGRK